MTLRSIDQLPSLDAALQSALAGESACIYAYGLIGAQLGADERRAAATALDDHSIARDRIRRELTTLKVTPNPGAAAYDPPIAVTNATGARKLAALVEDRMALVWADVVASARAAGSDAITELAAAAVATCAVRAARWSGTTEAFPGLASAPVASPTSSPSS